jgi:hypothetical protein
MVQIDLFVPIIEYLELIGEGVGHFSEDCHMAEVQYSVIVISDRDFVSDEDLNESNVKYFRGSSTGKCSFRVGVIIIVCCHPLLLSPPGTFGRSAIIGWFTATKA